MQVYGDAARTLDPHERLREIASASAILDRAPPGVARHDEIVRSFIAAGELTQGLADAEFEARGFDDLTQVQTAAMALLVALARRIAVSWRSDFRDGGGTPEAELAQLASLDLPHAVTCKTAEGYAFYALYPEAYVEAAAALPWRAPPLVLGLRSIGAGLAAAAAVGSGARSALTLRPTGPPFRRQLRVSKALRAQLAGHPGPFLIADEGPGLSGSSFGATADLLEDMGVAADRIAFLPSHPGGPGPEAAPRHQARWTRATRLVRTFDELHRRRPLERWFEDLIGPVHTLEDLSGGAWRQDLAPRTSPPAWPQQERLKFRLTTDSGVYLARFAGLDAGGAAKLVRARALHAAGFTPEPLALRRGFLLERWVNGTPLTARQRPNDFLDRLGRYLAWRSRAFPAASEPGASLAELRAMAVANAAELGGAGLGRAIAARLAGIERLQPRLRPIHIDGRLHPWEWRQTAAGVVKTDALDHACGHDLVGCQDVAWDVAGATVEFGLTGVEVDRLCNQLEAAGVRAPDDELRQAFAACYAAFQAGVWTFAADDPAERDRALAQRELYRRHLLRLAEPADA